MRKSVFLHQFSKKQRKHLPLFLLLLLLLPLMVYQVMQRQNLQNKAQSVADKPNIVVIMTDDQRWDAMETLPTVTGRLANKGVTFTNAYLTTPLCCPSRASFLTGLYTHNTGVFENEGRRNKNTDRLGEKAKQTIAVWLKQGGYKTGLFGKYLNGYERYQYTPPGWDRWFAFVNGQQYYNFEVSDNGRLRKFGNKPADYSVDVFGKEAVKFIRETKQPFFLLYTPNAPHAWNGENIKEEDDVPGMAAPPMAPRHKGECQVTPWKSPPSFNEQDISDKPDWIKKQPLVPANEVEKFRKAQLCSLKAVDETIADMIKALGEERMKNTVFIFYSDNGYSYGEHRYVKKNCTYEECARTTMVISYPGLIPYKRISEEFALNIDLAPTIAELAGVKIPVKVNGKSLVPLLTNPDADIRSGFLIEVRSGKEKFRADAIRTEEYKYVEYGSGEEELYNLIKDPYELENIADGKDWQDLKVDLAAKLRLLKQDKDLPPLSASISPTENPSPSKSNEKPTPGFTPTPTVKSSGKTPTLTASITPQTTPTTLNSDTKKSNPSDEVDSADDHDPDNSEKDPTTTKTLSLTLLLSGIGSAGDSINPTDSTLSNKEPLNYSRPISLQLFDAQKNPVQAVEDYIDYDAGTGKFSTEIILPESIPDGSYTIKVKITNYLTQSIPGTINLQKNQAVTIPEILMTTGDVNNDNQLSILDYNLLLSCFGDGELTDTCIEGNFVVGDLNDDAYVFEDDYNLFLRELSSQKK